MLVSTHLPLIAMGLDVVLSYDSPLMIMLLALHGYGAAARLPHMDFLTSCNVSVVYRALEVLSP